MGSPRRIRRLASCAALAATVVLVTASAPAKADVDRYGNSLSFLDAAFNPAPCNPSYAQLRVAAISGRDFFIPLFDHAVAWIDYFGVPVFVSPPFGASPGGNWPVPTASQMPAGRYTLHVLLQGNTEISDDPLTRFEMSLIFATVSDTATIAPGLNPDCSSIAARASASVTRKPSRHLLVRRVRAIRLDSDTWFERPLGPRAKYPQARFCGRSVCIQRRAGAAWRAVARY